MKIGLIYPSRSGRRTYSTNQPALQEFFDTNKNVPAFTLPSLSLLTVAACTPPDVEVKLLDERIAPIDFDEHFDLVGITMMTEQAVRGYELAARFNANGVTTVIGGIHASVVPEEAQRHADSVVIGECEHVWPVLIEDFRLGRLQPFYRNASLVDLEQSPTPRFDLVDPAVYPEFPMQTTRGCPLNCSFCTVTKVYGPKFRVKSIPKVLREVEAIQANARTRKIVFNDDNMFVNRPEAYTLLEALVPLHIKYFTQGDVSIAEDDRLLDLMSRSGCVTVFIGFESLVPANLDSLHSSRWKARRLDVYAEACRKIQSHGIQVLGAFIVGFDHDSPNVFDDLIEFVLSNRILGQFHPLTPLPGTRTREALIAEGRLPVGDDRWSRYTCFDVTFPPKLMSETELTEGLLKVYRAVYSAEAHLRRSRHMIDMLKLHRSRRMGAERA